MLNFTIWRFLDDSAITPYSKVFVFQVPTLISFTMMSSMCLISLWNGQSLESMFGFNTCVVFYSAVVLHNSLIVSSGFVSAFYRLMCVKSKGHLIKAKTLIICEYVFILIAFVPGKFEIHVQQIQLFFWQLFWFLNNQESLDHFFIPELPTIWNSVPAIPDPWFEPFWFIRK